MATISTFPSSVLESSLTSDKNATQSLQVFHETIYTSIYAMTHGELRMEVIDWLRFGHAKHRPRARGEERRERIPDMISIHECSPEVKERLVPV